MLQRNAQTDHIWFATPKRFTGIALLSLAASGVLLQLGSEDTEKDFFWDRFPHFSVSLIRSFGRGRLLSRWNLFPCKYRRNRTCLQTHSSTKTLRHVAKLEMYSEHTFWCPGDSKKSTNISTYGMYPSFLHFLFVWKLKESNLFSFWSNKPSFFHVSCDAS